MKNSILLAFFVVLISFETGESFTINCDYRMYSLPVIGIVYTCETTNIPTTSGNRVTAVTGQHWSERINNDVESIYIYGNWTLSFVPQGFSNFFPNIKAITIRHSTFKTLYGDELNEFSQLKFFNHFDSNLTTISSRLFEKTPKLVVIGFSSNPLQRVGRDLMTSLNLSQLVWVNFYGNRCINKSEYNGNQTAINLIINELRQSCPFDDEFSTTTEKNLICSERKIEDLVCDLKQQNEKLENELTKMREIFELRIKWLEDEVLSFSTNRCTYK